MVDGLHLIVDSPDDGRYVATTLVGCVAQTIGRTGPAIGVSDVIKVDSIDIIIPYNLPTDACQIGSHRRVGGVEIRPVEKLRMRSPFHKCSAPKRTLCTDRNSGYPGVNLHPSLVTLGHCEGQRVVVTTRHAALYARNTLVPWFETGWVNRCRTHSCLQENGVDICLLVFCRGYR